MDIQYKVSLVILMFSAVSLSCSIAFSQSGEIPCRHPESSQMDFWVGEWTAEWTDKDGKVQGGTNIITKTLNGCVIEENFSTSDKSFIGQSLSMYNPVKKIWQQTWVDNSGSYLDFTGGMEGDKMIFWRKALNKAGKEIRQRMVFYDITKDSFTWDWELSADEGLTWNLQWKILYKRKA